MFSSDTSKTYFKGILLTRYIFWESLKESQNASKHTLKYTIVMGLCLAIVSYMLKIFKLRATLERIMWLLPPYGDTLPILFVAPKNVSAMGMTIF